MFCCPYFTKSLCLDIKNRRDVIKKLYLLVKTMNMNDDNEKSQIEISTNSSEN